MPGYRYMVEGQIFDSGQGLNLLFRAFGDFNMELDVCVNVMIGKNMTINASRFPIEVNYNKGTANGCSVKYSLPPEEGFPVITLQVFVCNRILTPLEELPTVKKPEKSEKRTKCGIYNEGNTCYINVVLQTMFHIPLFRKMIYQIDPGREVADADNIVLQLHILFTKLETQKESVSASNLIRSFGWKGKQLRQQQDLSEFWRLLIQKLETKMTPSSVDNIFTGKIRSMFTCSNIAFRSTQEENFSQLVLNVDKEDSLTPAIDSYLKGSFLTGENKYMTPGWGLQDAQVTHQFVKLPPVLQLCLTRTNLRNTLPFRYDEILTFRIPDAVHYHLFAVHVRAGADASSGHYYTYLNLAMKDVWFKFNDSTVTEVTKREALDVDRDGTGVSHVYMLVYVRNDWSALLFEKIQPKFHSERVDEWIEREQEEEMRRLHAENDRKNSRFFEVITDEKISNCSWNFESLKSSIFIEGSQGGKAEYVKVQKVQNVSDLYEVIAANMKRDPDSFDLYFCTDNGRIGMKMDRDDVTTFETYGITEKKVYVLDGKYRTEEYKEATTTGFYAVAQNKADQVFMVFVYAYWPSRRFNPIHYLRPVIVKGGSSISLMVTIAAEYYGLGPVSAGAIYFSSTKFTRVNEQATFASMKVTSGERIIVELFDVEECPAPPAIRKEDNLFHYTDYVITFPPFDEFPLFISSMTTSEMHYGNTFRMISFPMRCLTIGDLLDFGLEHVFQAERGPHTSLYIGYDARPCANQSRLMTEYRNRGKGCISDFWIENYENEGPFSWRVIYWTSCDALHIDNIEPRKIMLQQSDTVVVLKEEVSRILSVRVHVLRVCAIKRGLIWEVLKDTDRLSDHGNQFRVEVMPTSQNESKPEELIPVHIDYPEMNANFLAITKKRDKIANLARRVEGMFTGINISKADAMIGPVRDRVRRVQPHNLLSELRLQKGDYLLFRYRETDMDDFVMRFEN